MNARMLGFFSGFPARCFPEAIAGRLRDALICRESLVFVSAWPADYDQNDSDAVGMHGMFAACGMPFNRFCVIDNRTTHDEAQELIQSASCIFLMGGHATQQFQLICEKGILKAIRESAAVILGVSAGASNMAVHALDIWESPVPYEGLGLADVTIKAHVAPTEQELLQKLMQVSKEQGLPICAMEDESGIFIQGHEVTHTGMIRWIDKGRGQPFSPEFLRV